MFKDLEVLYLILRGKKKDLLCHTMYNGCTKKEQEL